MSVETLAEWSGLKRRSVQLSLRELEDKSHVLRMGYSAKGVTRYLWPT